MNWFLQAIARLLSAPHPPPRDDYPLIEDIPPTRGVIPPGE